MIHAFAFAQNIDTSNARILSSSTGYDSTLTGTKNLPASTIEKKRLLLVSSISAATYTGSLIALNNTWYKGYPRTSFHTFNDWGEWSQMDKIGHSWSVYNLSRASTAAWRWAGLNEKKAVVAGSVSGFAFVTMIEILDGYSEKWGWSWGDMGANLTGSSLFALQQIGWGEQRIQFKYSAHKKNYEPSLSIRANELFGKSSPERLLKDYNGQAYWYSFNLKAFAPRSKLPGWLNLSVGYGADGMFGGYENIAVDKNGNTTFERRDIKRRRQWYLSPDIDVTKINTRSKLLKTFFAGLNSIKIPAPSLEFANGRVRGHWLYF
jgi:uncharacterized protein YfiM (DUF2279 family)